MQDRRHTEVRQAETGRWLQTGSCSACEIAPDASVKHLQELGLTWQPSLLQMMLTINMDC